MFAGSTRSTDTSSFSLVVGAKPIGQPIPGEDRVVDWVRKGSPLAAASNSAV